MENRRILAFVGLLSVPTTLLLAFLTPVQATAADEGTPSWMRTLDGVHSLADRVWLEYGGSLDRYQFWGRWTVLGYLGAIAGLWAFRRLSAPAVNGSRVLLIAFCVAAVADVGAYWSPDGSVASHAGGSIEFFMLPVIFGSALWYGWMLRRRTHRSRWPGWALIGATALVPVSMAATNYWPHGLLVPIAAGISILAVAATTGLSVEHQVAFANGGSRITDIDSSVDGDRAETE